MNLLKVAVAAVNQTPLDWAANQAHLLDTIAAARDEGVGVLCLPELCTCGYGCEDAFLSANTRDQSMQVLLELVAETKGMAVSIGLPIWFRGGLYNMACLAVDGKIAGFVGKQNLAYEGIHYETRWFKPWPRDLRAEIQIEGQDYPLGDLIFDCGGIRIGFEICEDAWVADRPGKDLSQSAVDLILNPSASHFAFDKQATRRRLVLESSRAYHVAYLYSNLLGNEAGRAIYDGGTMIAAGGTMLAEGPRFSYRDFLLTTAVIDIDAARTKRAQSGALTPPSTQQEEALVHVPFEWPEAEPLSSALPAAAWETGDTVKEEEFARAVALGLFDYLRKSHSQGFVVSLSGGADSATVVTLISIMTHLALDEWGAERLAQKLGRIDLTDVSTAKQWVGQLLTTVYQSTRNSSKTTREAAREVAGATGAEFLELDVDSLVEQYVEIVGNAVGQPLTWENDDVALQNIQARVRSPSVWLLANLKNRLLLSTSNRSEAAVGYATMDGDTSGGLAPIAGIDKAFLREWLLWMEKQGPEEVGPMPALAAVNRQQPTAELRPPDAKQTDEDDLMPYNILDAIERIAIRDKQAPPAAYQLMKGKFPEVPPRQLGTWVERFFQLWCRNQWKRERYAPSFHLDDANLDPKTWCRFPILSGGFARELAELREIIEREDL